MFVDKMCLIVPRTQHKLNRELGMNMQYYWPSTVLRDYALLSLVALRYGELHSTESRGIGGKMQAIVSMSRGWLCHLRKCLPLVAFVWDTRPLELFQLIVEFISQATAVLINRLFVYIQAIVSGTSLPKRSSLDDFDSHRQREPVSRVSKR